jgi:carbon monoxide dehydrogenase subunit G
MELKNELRINASRAAVWAALNDPETLKASIPGCEQIEQVAVDVLRAVVKTKVGPVSARFSGVVTLSEVDAPRSYTISFQGEGGAAGFVNGGARVDLHEDGAVTLLRYEARANVGGKLAQIGSRLIDSAAAKTAADFFKRFTDFVESGASKHATMPGAPPAQVQAEPPAHGA